MACQIEQEAESAEQAGDSPARQGRRGVELTDPELPDDLSGPRLFGAADHIHGQPTLDEPGNLLGHKGFTRNRKPVEKNGDPKRRNAPRRTPGE